MARDSDSEQQSPLPHLVQDVVVIVVLVGDAVYDVLADKSL